MKNSIFWLVDKYDGFELTDLENNNYKEYSPTVKKYNVVLPSKFIIVRDFLISKFNLKSAEKRIWPKLLNTLPKEKENYTFVYDITPYEHRYLVTVYFIEKEKIKSWESIITDHVNLPQRIICWEIFYKQMLNSEKNGLIFHEIDSGNIICTIISQGKIFLRNEYDLDELKTSYEKINTILKSEFTQTQLDKMDTAYIVKDKLNIINEIVIKNSNTLSEKDILLNKKPDKKTYFSHNVFKFLKNLEIDKSGQKISRKHIFSGLLFLLGTVLILNAGLLLFNLKAENSIKDDLDTAKKSKNLNKVLKVTRDEMKTLIEFSEEEKLVSLLKDISLRLPFKIVLTNFEYKKDDTLKLNGSSDNYNDIVLMITLLKQIPNFSAIELEHTKDKDGVSEFDITCTVKSSKEKKKTKD